MEQSPRMQLPARASAPLIRPRLPLRVSGVRSRCGEHDGLGGDADTEPMRSCHTEGRDAAMSFEDRDDDRLRPASLRPAIRPSQLIRVRTVRLEWYAGAGAGRAYRCGEAGHL